MYGILEAENRSVSPFFPLNPKGTRAPSYSERTPQMLTSGTYASTVEALTRTVHIELKRQNRLRVFYAGTPRQNLRHAGGLHVDGAV